MKIIKFWFKFKRDVYKSVSKMYTRSFLWHILFTVKQKYDWTLPRDKFEYFILANGKLYAGKKWPMDKKKVCVVIRT